MLLEMSGHHPMNSDGSFPIRKYGYLKRTEICSGRNKYGIYMDLCDVHHALRELYSSACSSYVLSFGSFNCKLRSTCSFLLPVQKRSPPEYEGEYALHAGTDRHQYPDRFRHNELFMSWVAFGALLLWSLLGGGRGD